MEIKAYCKEKLRWANHTNTCKVRKFYRLQFISIPKLGNFKSKCCIKALALKDVPWSILLLSVTERIFLKTFMFHVYGLKKAC